MPLKAYQASSGCDSRNIEGKLGLEVNNGHADTPVKESMEAQAGRCSKGIGSRPTSVPGVPKLLTRWA